jgi:hypothetical protein
MHGSMCTLHSLVDLNAQNLYNFVQCCTNLPCHIFIVANILQKMETILWRNQLPFAYLEYLLWIAHSIDYSLLVLQL